MSDVLFLDEMEALFGHGCASPDCTHAFDDGPMAVSSRCHPGEGVILGMAPPGALPCVAILQCACWVCQRLIGSVALTLPFTEGSRQAGRHGQAMDVLYQGGRVSVECRHCATMVFTAAVATLPATGDDA
jgi:hypothetical protein